jgi:hypothetical protein
LALFVYQGRQLTEPGPRLIGWVHPCPEWRTGLQRRGLPRHETRVGRRRLCAHATSARDRPWRRALPKTQSDDRAGVREHQVQPADRPLPPPRQICRALRMATDHRHPQPSQAPQAPNGRRSSLTKGHSTTGQQPGPSLATTMVGNGSRESYHSPFTQQPRRAAVVPAQAHDTIAYAARSRRLPVLSRRDRASSGPAF